MIASRPVTLLSVALLSLSTLHAQKFQTVSDNDDRAERHRSSDWLTIEPHLPDPGHRIPGRARNRRRCAACPPAAGGRARLLSFRAGPRSFAAPA